MRRKPLRVRVTGIYKITNTATGEFYVGMAIDVEVRVRTHLRQLAEHRHPNDRMQASFDQHGAENFAAELIESWPDRFTMEHREREIIGQLKPAFNRNGPHLPGSLKGRKCPSHSVKMRAFWTDEQRAKASARYRLYRALRGAK